MIHFLLHFATGIFLAIMCFNYQKKIEIILQNKFFLRSTLFIAFFYYLMHAFFPEVYHMFYLIKIINPVIENIFYLILIYNFAFNPFFVNSIRSSFFLLKLSELGKKYTYSIYLLHPVAITFSILIIRSFKFVENFTIFVTVSFILTAIMSWLSYRLIERKMDKVRLTYL
jgi:peptidoglycan/LPS O-acetylase OafA/YrhL